MLETTKALSLTSVQILAIYMTYVTWLTCGKPPLISNVGKQVKWGSGHAGSKTTMENSNSEKKKREHESIQNSMQNLSIPSSSDSHISCDHHGKQIREAEQQPHEALFLVLAYLPLYELLVMSEACIALREAVSRDVLPWLNIVVPKILCSRVSDEALMKITSKSDGRLTTLSLINCVKITDVGLQRVIQNNPFIDQVVGFHFPNVVSVTVVGSMIFKAAA
ncbi:hypothetical protein JRO89_XS05G0221700 [Xanthoceras sorbifolium]|uniref:F-box domain-containing protein n=1 Tax=Xanthoceras sorbifolium TaxID=99658 RepID=A0ABQ8I2S1_9ROSI|nr:hypothetical protein JRO89_XS05G0221700 [Xanthoceras sorbifolium]